MPNYKLDELLSMSIDETRSIAQSLGIKTNSSQTLQDIAYLIIDEQAIVGSQTKKRKTTKAEKATAEVTSTSVDSETSDPAPEGEKKRRKRTRKVAETDNETETKTETLATTETTTEETKKPRKGRTRKATAATGNNTEEETTTENTAKTAEPANDNTYNAEETQQQPSLFDQQETAPTKKTSDKKSEKEPETDFIIIQDIPPLEPEYTTSADFSTPETTIPTITPSPKNDNYNERNTARTTSYDFGESIIGRGVLDITSEGQAFLRSADYNYLPSPDDIFVSNQQIKYYGLKIGDVVEGPVRIPRENEKVFPLVKVTRINGLTPEQVRDRLSFEHLTPLFPNEKFNLCKGDGSDSLSTRIVDLFAPIGKGQRALLVAQPKTGKTMIMKAIANAIAANHPEAYLMMLLIDERPEEVTDMARTVNAEVIASTFDEPASNHVKIAGIVLEKAKRMVECGHDVVIFLDSITRLARAYNTVAPASGKILTGGVDANALQKPKRFFGAARNIEGGGSLTIIATALIDTGSRMDEVIFEEFKGTGNMELQLDRSLSNKRIFPAVNCVASSTRRDDLLHDKMTLDRMWVLRNHIAEMTPMESMNIVKNLMEKTKNNEEFLLSMNS
ncbi:MAG: transcription termination factor Rho [Prevotellaceae bacterium]|nr:transcription termination factor Rho [Prevotellaceae bacterium]